MELLPERIQSISVDKIPIKREVVHTIKDTNFPRFHVYKSANGWWNDLVKVQNLIKAFKDGNSITSALKIIGISWEQWNYFNKIHPEFCKVKQGCENLANTVVPVFRAYREAMENPYVAMRWLTKKGYFEEYRKEEKELEAMNRFS